MKMKKAKWLKRFTMVIAMIVLTTLLVGCKSAEVRSVEKEIDSAYEYFMRQLDSSSNYRNEYMSSAISDVYEAQRSFNKLSDQDKQKVKNKDLLDEAVYDADFLVSLETGYSALEFNPDSYDIESYSTVPVFTIKNNGICTYKDIKVEIVLYDRNCKKTSTEIVKLDFTLEHGDIETWAAISGRLSNKVLTGHYFSLSLYDYTKVSP